MRILFLLLPVKCSEKKTNKRLKRIEHLVIVWQATSMLIRFYCPNLTSEKRFIRCSIPCIVDLCTAPSSVFQQIWIRYENPKLPKSADEEMVRLGWLLVGKNMDELKRKNLPKNDPRTQICPLVGSCAFLAFHLPSLFFGRRAFMWGLCQISPSVYEQDDEPLENNLDGKHCQFLSSANLSNWYIISCIILRQQQPL